MSIAIYLAHLNPVTNAHVEIIEELKQEIKTYSDGTQGVTNNTSTLGIANTVETESKVERELIREYAILIIDDKDTDTINIFTEEEYLARADVSLYDTDTYREAVWKMNSRINKWYTTEVLSKHYGNHLEVVGAPIAWSRGYTGDGSTIAILDSGIDMDHSEFEDSILGAECFTKACERNIESIDDKNRYSHGTHVAGIAAANLDGVGTTGVAYDADLLIAKTAFDSGYFDFSVADEAIAWAVDNGADVINISANYYFDNTYMNSLEEIENNIGLVKKHMSMEKDTSAVVESKPGPDEDGKFYIDGVLYYAADYDYALHNGATNITVQGDPWTNSNVTKLHE